MGLRRVPVGLRRIPMGFPGDVEGLQRLRVFHKCVKASQEFRVVSGVLSGLRYSREEVHERPKESQERSREFQRVSEAYQGIPESFDVSGGFSGIPKPHEMM